MTQRHLTHATRRFILGVIIALNTILIAFNLFGLRDTSAALINFFASCAAWYRDWETDRKSTRLNSSH